MGFLGYYAADYYETADCWVLYHGRELDSLQHGPGVPGTLNLVSELKPEGLADAPVPYRIHVITGSSAR